jgi:excisionase family DNA binding protein
MTEIEKLMDAQPVADALGITTKRCYELARTNMLPCVRLGRQIRFRPSELRKWIDGGGAALPGGWRREAR